MANRRINNVKLGLFVTAGVFFLVLLLYTIGKNHHLFGDTFEIRARFHNARGLMPGNNIRYAGIDAGTVRDVKVIDDSTIEARLLVKAEMRTYIKKNARAYISTDGIMGNKLVNIEPAAAGAPAIEEGDVLLSKKGADTDEMLAILNNTNNDLAIIAASLKTTISRINASKSIWSILGDSSLPKNVRASFSRFRNASENMEHMMSDLESAAADINAGRGTLGQLIKDTAVSHSIMEALAQVQKAGKDMDSTSLSVKTLIDSIHTDIRQSRGMAGSILNDSIINKNFGSTIHNLEQGTSRFNENMEALKHNFFFRSYFRKLEKQHKNP